jgi:hypothetical protein
MKLLREIRRRPRDEHLKYRLQKMYYRPGGYYRTAKKMWDACKKIGYKFTLTEVEDWLNKQAIYQVHKPPPPKIININKNYIGNPNINLGSDVIIITEELANRLGIYRNRSTLSGVGDQYCVDPG